MARAFHRTLKLALTIADPSVLLRKDSGQALAGDDTIGVAHPLEGSGQALAEALQYRPRGTG